MRVAGGGTLAAFIFYIPTIALEVFVSSQS